MKLGSQNVTIIIIALVILLTASSAFGYWLYTKKADLEFEVTTLTNKLSLAEAELSALNATNTSLTAELTTEKERNNEFAEQIDEISGTVGTLKKLSETDKELLQKYSKVYFLNENYVPSNLTTINKDYAVTPDKKLEIHADVKPFLADLLEAAADEDVELKIVSAYRSFGAQVGLKAAYRFTYGATANNFSAEQGFSEHQLGTTLDFTTEGVGASLAGFEKTEAYQWLQDNAYKYGFILSYPEGNGYYQFEPWHWRFVGEDLASDLHKNNKSFYSLDQREIDTYLVKIFD